MSGAGLETPLIQRPFAEVLAELEKERETLTPEQLDAKRREMVDGYTGTKFKKKKKEEFVIPTSPPDFTDIKSESALIYIFDFGRGWSCHRKAVKIGPKPFAKGSLRWAYHMAVVGESKSYVAKISNDPFEEKSAYFQDVTTQMYAKEYAKKYNQCRPPKVVDFLAVNLLELIDRADKPLCTAEQFIAGSYRKYNSNYGYVNEEERNTPQSLAHFSYEASSHEILVCDIQGVGDLYTDPQIHSRDGKYFGKGNMGPRGFEKFLKSHKCNAICRYLRLPPVNAKRQDSGTVPRDAYMPMPTLSKVTLNLELLASDPLACRLSEGRRDSKCCCVIL